MEKNKIIIDCPSNEMTNLPNMAIISHYKYKPHTLPSLNSKNNPKMALTKFSLILLLSLLVFYSKTVKSQNCSCAPNLCCSQFGYCGTTADYCGSTCRSGPCRGGGPPTGAGLVGSIVTQSFFNNIINLAGNGCAGKRFYTRDSFINATNTFPNFANTVTRREIATMFAHFTFETGRKNLFLSFKLFFLFFIYQAIF